MNIEYRHDPVLIDEVVAALDLSGGAVVVDGTLGLGGHAERILQEIGKDGKLIGFDCDERHLEFARVRLRKHEKNTIFVRSNFAHLKSELLNLGIEMVDGILLDLGIASPHVDHAERGFSFRFEGPLDMRLDHRLVLRAVDIVNDWSVEDMARIFREYGDERNAMKIAEAIDVARRIQKIETTVRLAEIILNAVHKKERIHPATRVFQSLRIAVNDELGVLEDGLNGALEMLKVGGRLVVISYHSLEDRIVKRRFQIVTRPKTEETIYSLHEIVELAKFRLITKKPILPTAREVELNSRSRSARLRVVEKIKI